MKPTERIDTSFVHASDQYLRLLMTTFGWLEIIVFAAMIGLLTRPLGGYLTRVYAGERIVLQSLFGSIEAAIYRCAISLLIFHALGIFALYVLLRAQPILPVQFRTVAGR